MQHDATHEARLVQLLTEEPGNTAEVRALLESCERCRDELERLRAVAARARAALELEREVLREARAATGKDDVDALRNALHAGRAAELHRRARARSRLQLLAVAAAACLLLVAGLRQGWFRTGGEQLPAQPPEQLLGGALTIAVEIRDGRYHAITWDASDEPEITYALTLRQVEEGRMGAEIRKIPGLTKARFEPPPELEEELPDTLFVEVQATNALGEERGSGFSRVSRR